MGKLGRMGGRSQRGLLSRANRRICIQRCRIEFRVSALKDMTILADTSLSDVKT